MAVTRGPWGELLIPGAKAVFVDDYNELPATYPSIYDVDTSGRAFEDDLVATGMPVVVSRPEGEPIPFDRPKFRGKVRYIHAGFGLGYEITREAVDDDLYSVLNSQAAANLARSHRETEEIVTANVFNDAFDEVQAYDGVSVFNTAHPQVGSGTLPNRPSPDQDISVAALKSALERFFDLRTDRNIRISMAPDRLVVNHNNWWTVQEILNTQVVTGASADGEISSIISAEAHNVTTRMGLTPVMWRYLTDDNAWFLLAPKAQTRVRFYWRRSPDPVSGTADREQVAWFGITSRFSAGITDWHGLDGSTGT
jgi:hypothetical protein